MTDDFDRKVSDLESTIQAGNVSYEGIDHLIGECVKASNGETGDLAIAVVTILRNLTTAKIACSKVHTWAVEKHGSDIVDPVLDRFVKKLQLEAALSLEN